MSFPVTTDTDHTLVNKVSPGTAVEPKATDVQQRVSKEQNPDPLPLLLTPLTIRGCSIKNRLWLSPMCMYSANNGLVNDFHFVHYMQFAVRGAGLVMLEATAVLPEARITPGCLGIWSDEHIGELKRLATAMKRCGTVAGIQLGHSGRLGSSIPLNKYAEADLYKVDADSGGWPDRVFGPSPIPFSSQFCTPKELDKARIDEIQSAFVDAAVRADKAGFDVIDIHAAYGMLLNQFLSPTSNKRTDGYGGSFENRIRMLIEVVERVRRVWPPDKLMFVSLPVLEGVDGGWSADDAISLARVLSSKGVDMSELSVGGNSPDAKISGDPVFKMELVCKVKQQLPGYLVAAVGVASSGMQANRVLEEGCADAVFSGRQYLRNPSFVLSAASDLGVNVQWIDQYQCARPNLKYDTFF
ncbi:hypothetical protein EV175_000880 [Coemansia sp. RSA 1933]|nr:hypothetical protein EV175_000880 [Coemansia sp. RSA 1933]